MEWINTFCNEARRKSKIMIYTTIEEVVQVLKSTSALLSMNQQTIKGWRLEFSDADMGGEENDDRFSNSKQRKLAIRLLIDGSPVHQGGVLVETGSKPGGSCDAAGGEENERVEKGGRHADPYGLRRAARKVA